MHNTPVMYKSLFSYKTDIKRWRFSPCLGGDVPRSEVYLPLPQATTAARFVAAGKGGGNGRVGRQTYLAHKQVFRSSPPSKQASSIKRRQRLSRIHPGNEREGKKRAVVRIIFPHVDRDHPLEKKPVLLTRMCKGKSSSAPI